MAKCGVRNVSKPQRIGLFGGTFDPVHNGHLAVADRVQQAFKLDGLWFIPALIPPHKKDGHDYQVVSSFTDRAAMLELALADREACLLSRIEAELPIPSYTVDTLQEIRQRLGPEAVLFFIIGVDAFVEIATWKNYRQLPALASFVVISRPACKLDRVAEVVGRYYKKYRYDPARQIWEPEGEGEKIHLLAMEPVAISSTEIRRRVRAGLPIDEWVPAAVAKYIPAHGLYKREVARSSLF
jgi:nicotinate-nucleotide adenylyltransferase